jgi:hypothetical protein
VTIPFTSLPDRLQRAIQDAILASTENDVFMVNVERDDQLLIIDCSHAGSSEVVEKFSLEFDQESETYKVQSRR